MPRTRLTATRKYTAPNTGHQRSPARVHPVEAVEPALRRQRRAVAAEAAALDLEAEQPQPVAQPPVADELARRAAGTAAPSPAQPRRSRAAALAQAPQAGRVEADDHHAAFGHQHALDFAQASGAGRAPARAHAAAPRGRGSSRKRQRVEVALQHRRALWRIVGGVDRRRLIGAGIGRQPADLCSITGRRVDIAGIAGQPSVRHAVAAQRVEFGQAELQCMKAEQIDHAASS